MKRIFTLVALVLAGLAGCASTVGSAKWVTLFDGSNLNQWYRVGDANWRLAGGAVEADKGKGNSFLVSRLSYTDFELRAEFWVDSQANSGIFIRCPDSAKIGAAECYEVNIWDARPDPSYGTGAIVNVAKVAPMPRAGGQWNVYEISAIGDRLIVTLNGQRTVDVRDGKHARGVIALQYGEVKTGGVVKFRKVEIRPL
jgi:hypothetical protein